MSTYMMLPLGIFIGCFLTAVIVLIENIRKARDSVFTISEKGRALLLKEREFNDKVSKSVMDILNTVSTSGDDLYMLNSAEKAISNSDRFNRMLVALGRLSKEDHKLIFRELSRENDSKVVLECKLGMISNEILYIVDFSISLEEDTAKFVDKEVLYNSKSGVMRSIYMLDMTKTGDLPDTRVMKNRELMNTMSFNNVENLVTDIKKKVEDISVSVDSIKEP